MKLSTETMVPSG